jgi:hypothetical protein
MDRFIHFALVIVSIAVINGSALAQYNSESFSAMKWRLVGPHRAGRVTAVAGIPSKPSTYYFGTPGGGVWKTTSGGRVWDPIFDEAHVVAYLAAQEEHHRAQTFEHEFEMLVTKHGLEWHDR